MTPIKLALLKAACWRIIAIVIELVAIYIMTHDLKFTLIAEVILSAIFITAYAVFELVWNKFISVSICKKIYDQIDKISLNYQGLDFIELYITRIGNNWGVVDMFGKPIVPNHYEILSFDKYNECIILRLNGYAKTEATNSKEVYPGVYCSYETFFGKPCMYIIYGVKEYKILEAK